MRVARFDGGTKCQTVNGCTNRRLDLPAGVYLMEVASLYGEIRVKQLGNETCCSIFRCKGFGCPLWRAGRNMVHKPTGSAAEVAYGKEGGKFAAYRMEMSPSAQMAVLRRIEYDDASGFWEEWEEAR